MMQQKTCASCAGCKSNILRVQSEMESFCTKCGRELQPGVVFCGGCDASRAGVQNLVLPIVIPIASWLSLKGFYLLVMP